MRPPATCLRAAIATAILVVALMPPSVDVAVAHAGHGHAAAGGFDGTVILQVAGTAIALGVAYLLASLVFRSRDGSDG